VFAILASRHVSLVGTNSLLAIVADGCLGSC